jgi:hypothetical protein
MHKIVFNKPILINREYVIFFDSDNKFTFKNKRIAQDFLTHIEREAEQAVLFITEELNSLEEFYRLYYLADDDFKFKFQVNNCIDYLNNRLAYIHSHHGTENFNSIAFHSVLNCMKELKESFITMAEKAVQRHDTITKRRCALKVALIEMYLKNLLTIGVKPKQQEKTQLRVKIG